MEKVPQLPTNIKPPKMKKSLILMRGPELIHNRLIHGQYGIIVSTDLSGEIEPKPFPTISSSWIFHFIQHQAMCGGRMHSGHVEMVRMTVNRKMDTKRMFAIWRIDAPWQPLTKRVQYSISVSCEPFKFV